jgi:hypothetical protein
MDKIERERLEKACQSAQLLSSDLRELHAKTDDMALEILASEMLGQVARMSQVLTRLAEQK